MPYRHPLDLVTWRRFYYRTHKQEMNAYSRSYYETHKDDPEFKRKRAEYMRRFRHTLR